MHVLPIMMIDFSLQTGVVEDSIGGTCMCQPKGSDDFEDEDFSIFNIIYNSDIITYNIASNVFITFFACLIL